MFEEVLVDQNPHWNKELYDSGIERDVLNKARKYIDLPHIISIVGVRRSGKSTLIKQIINMLIQDKGVNPKNILFVNLETPRLNNFRNEIIYLERIFEDYLKLTKPEGRIYCFIDEVQFFSQWQVFVKSCYEKKNIKMFITGSNSRLLSSEFITLLSGRTLAIEVFPFSFLELMKAKGIDVSGNIEIVNKRHQIKGVLDEYMHDGGFPEIAFIMDKDIKDEVLAMYARNVLYQDIAPRFSVKKPVDLENLFFYLASNTSCLYTYNNLAKITKISDKTVKEYLSYFTDAYLLFSVDAFHFSIKRQMQSPKKIYAVDNGIARASSMHFSKNAGHFLENLVFLELNRRGCELFYYKTRQGHEVDFACVESGKISELIQVVHTISNEKTRERELRAIIRAMDETGLKKGLIVTYEDEERVESSGMDIQILPAYKFLTDSNAL